jgi:hypothetical protein
MNMLSKLVQIDKAHYILMFYLSILGVVFLNLMMVLLRTLFEML